MAVIFEAQRPPCFAGVIVYFVVLIDSFLVFTLTFNFNGVTLHLSTYIVLEIIHQFELVSECSGFTRLVIY